MPEQGSTAEGSTDRADSGVTDGPGGPPRRRRFRLRVHITTLFVGLIVAAGAALVGYGYLATSKLLLDAGDDEFLNVGERTASQLRDLLEPARLLVQILTRHRLTRVTTLRDRLDALPLLTSTVAAHPEISAVYLGFAGGDFFLVRSLNDAIRPGLRAPPAAVFLVQSVLAQSPPGRFLFLDGQLGVVTDEPRPDYRFDPRTRVWYQRALAASGAVLTRPYVFFTTREVGTTMAQRSPDGTAVVGVDITLQALSRHLARSRMTPSTRIALVDPDGLVVAHPDADRLFRRDAAAPPDPGPSLPRLADLGDRALVALFAPDQPPRGGRSLRVGGREWVGVKRPIEAAGGDPLMLLLAAPRDELVADARGLAERQLLIGLGVLLLAVALVWLSARRISRPLEALARSVERIGGGDLDTSLPAVWNPLEVGALRDAVDRMRGQIKGHIVERAARLAEEQRRARELEIARQIQLSMLPASPGEPLDGRFVVAATLRPAREVGGDLYDFFVVDGHRLLFAIGDVADKGIPAALLMARVTGLFRAIARGDAGPDGILRELDARLSQGNETAMFVTMACGDLDGDTGLLRYASAGHERPLLRKADGTTSILTLDGGPALGLDLGGEFPLWSSRLDPGDALVVCTDGATEAFDTHAAPFGLDGLREVLAGTPTGGLATFPDRLVAAIERFAAGGGPRDDLAVLAVQLRPPGGA